MSNPFTHQAFVDSNGEAVPYDGSPVSWRVSAYAVIVENRQVLLIRSKADRLYDVVGGSIELGETIEAALAREALEEAGAKLQIGELLGTHQDFFYHRAEGKFYQTLLLYFAASRLGEFAPPTDAKIVFREWVDLDRLNEYPMLGYLREVVEKAVEK